MAEGADSGDETIHLNEETRISVLDDFAEDERALAIRGNAGSAIVPRNSEMQIAVPSNQNELATSQPPEVVIGGGNYQGVVIGPQINKKTLKANDYRHAKISHTYYYNHYGGDQEKSKQEPSSVKESEPKKQSSKPGEGYMQISEDIFMYNKEPLRKGTKVYKGYQQHASGNHRDLAIKVIFGCDETQIKEVQHLLTLSSHPNIVQIIESRERHSDARILYIAMELCEQNLQDYINEKRGKKAPLDFDQTMSFSKQLVSGLKYIHSHKIVHRDFKPENVLMSSGILKLSDFGISKQLRADRSIITQTYLGQGSIGYKAPEIHTSEVISRSADIFPLGITMFNLWSNGKHPFGDKLLLRDHNIVENEGLDLSGLLLSGIKKDQLVNLIGKTLQHDPLKRPSIEEVAKHPFFSSELTTENLEGRESSLPEPDLPAQVTSLPTRERRSKKGRQEQKTVSQPSTDSSKGGEKRPLQPFVYEPKCDKNLLNFICGKEKHLGILKNVFDRFAAIEVMKKKETVLLKFTSRKLFSTMTQEIFEEKCKKDLESHISKYSISRSSFDKKRLEKARRLKLLPQIEEAYTRDKTNDLVVSWQRNKPTVEIIGLKEAVDHMMQRITNGVNSTVDTKTFRENEFGILQNCGIITDLKNKYGSLLIKCDTNDFSVTFIGPDDDVRNAKYDCLHALMLDKKKLSGLDENVLKYLSESMRKSPEIASTIQGKLKRNGIKAVIALDDNEPCIKAKTNEDFKKALQVVKQYVTVDVIKTDEAKSDVIKSEEWNTFYLTLGDSGLFAIYIKPGENITLVGTKSKVKALQTKIKTFLDDNAISRLFVNMEYGKAKFIIERSREFSSKMCEQKKVKCELSPEDSGGLVLHGKRTALETAHGEVRRLFKEIIEKSFTLETSGIKEYYSSEDGKQFLGNVECVNNCVILTETRENPEWVEYSRKRGTSVRRKKRPLFNMFVYARRKDVLQAMDAITTEVKKVVYRDVIEDHAISRLTEWEKYEINETAERHNVKIIESSNRYVSRLILEGLAKEVMWAHLDVRNILKEFSEAETCSTAVVWQKKHSSGKWEECHPRSAAVMEKAYLARTSGVGTSWSSVWLSDSGAPSHILVPEFHRGRVVKHVVDITSPEVRRRTKDRSANDIPDFWDDMKGEQSVLVPLQPDSQEYQSVFTKFTTSPQVFHRSIVSIERIQNLHLYEQYVEKRSEITYKRENFQGQIERSLFHGTGNNDKIEVDGFDRSSAGAYNIRYGRGVYFTADPGFSHDYAPPNNLEQRRMFLADVLTGEFCVGNRNLVAPPQKPSSHIRNDHFDSTVDNAINPTIFVIFNNMSAYPSYRITYT